MFLISLSLSLSLSLPFYSNGSNEKAAQPCKSEITELYVAIACDQDILWLHVAMDDSVRV